MWGSFDRIYALLVDFAALLIIYWALLSEYRALLIEYWVS